MPDIEDVKGKAKEAGGALAEDETMKREGQAQQTKAEAEEEAAKKRSQADAAEDEQIRNQ